MNETSGFPVFLMSFMAAMCVVCFFTSLHIARCGFACGYILAALCAVAVVFWGFQANKNLHKLRNRSQIFSEKN